MTTIFFLISMFAILGLLVSKVVEIKVKKIDFIHGAFARGDKKLHEVMSYVLLKYYRYKKIASIFIFEFLPAYGLELLIKAKNHLVAQYHETQEKFRGARVLRSDGSVSFFLDQLRDNKSPIEKKS